LKGWFLFRFYLRNVDLIWQVFKLWIVIIQVQHSAKDNFCTLSKRAKEKYLEQLKPMMAFSSDGGIVLLNVLSKQLNKLQNSLYCARRIPATNPA